MRTIKFRGIAKFRGRAIFGDLTQDKRNVYVNDEAVYPDSVKQLIGYDMNGDEIYEGDPLISKIGTAEAFSRVYCGNDGGNFGDTFDNWRLHR